MKIKKRMIKKLTFISGLMLIINMSFSGVFFIAQLASANGIGSMDNECQDFGFDFGVAKWEYDDGHWIFGIANNGTSVTGTDMEALWDVGESDATGIIIKAGSTVYERIDGTSGTVNQANPNLSHITFCGDNKETPYCGDGQISGDEQCDNDQANGQVCVPEYGTSCAYCTAGCDEITLEGPKCGDGIANGNEQCDDGNTNNGDGCSAACEIEETLFCQLTLTKSDAGYDPVQPGAEMVYHLTLTNTGTADCTGGGVLLKDVFDAVTSYISAVPEPMNVNEDENYIKWNFGTIKPDEMKNIDLTMKVSADAAYGSTLLNRAVYWSDQTGWGQEVNETTAVYCPQPDLGSICGYKFNDLNKNSQRDNEEPGLPDWTIGLGYTMGDAAVYISTSTDANGYYCFTSLLPKEYTIAEQLKNGWTNSTPLYQSIILGEGDNTTVNFGNYIPDIEPVYGGISGYKFGDSDGLASTTDDQVGLAGWLINLFNSSSTSTPIATTTTNANGYYEFANLTAGEYALSEIMLSGWTQMSAPAAIDLTAGENSPNNNFVNYYENIIEPICGDGIVNQEIEQCDGTAGIINHYICTQSCRLEYVPYCGDNIKNGAEQCDGTDGLVSGKTCNNQCVLTGGGGGGGAFIITNAHGFLPEVKGEEGKPILSIDKTVNADFANAGDVVEYSIKLINNGNLTAFNVVLSDELPNGFTSAIDNSKILTFSLGDILPGENRTTTYKVKISDNAPAGIYANLARASASNHDPIVDTVNLEVRKVETLGIELPATGFSLKEFLSIVLVIIIALGSITIGKKSYNNL